MTVAEVMGNITKMIIYLKHYGATHITMKIEDVIAFLEKTNDDLASVPPETGTPE